MIGSNISVAVYGKEKTRIRAPDSVDTSERRFLAVELPLKKYRPHEMVEQGSYVFPFCIRLPSSLPASTHYPPVGTRGDGFFVQYTVQASVGRTTQTQLLAVRSLPLPETKVPYIVEPSTHALKGLGFLDKGVLTVGASVEDVHIGRGQDLALRLACQNLSTATIQRVDVKVLEINEWMTERRIRRKEGGHRTRKLTRLGVTMLSHLPDVQLPTLLKAKSDHTNVRRRLSNPQVQRDTYQAIYQSLQSPGSDIRIRIPSVARDTYQGQCASVTHAIEITFATGPRKTNPRVRIPLRIGTAPDPPAVPAPIPTVTAERVEADIAVPPVADYTPSEIPFATAVVVPMDATQASMVTAPPKIIRLGADAILVERYEDIEPIPPPPPPTEATRVPSFATLLEEMIHSENDVANLTRHLEDDEWKYVLSRLSSEEFGLVIAHVQNNFDQPKVAELLAPLLTVTCEYIAAALRHTWNRPVMLERLLPFCVDFATHERVLLAELSVWEQTVAQPSLDVARRYASAS